MEGLQSSRNSYTSLIVSIQCYVGCNRGLGRIWATGCVKCLPHLQPKKTIVYPNYSILGYFYNPILCFKFFFIYFFQHFFSIFQGVLDFWTMLGPWFKKIAKKNCKKITILYPNRSTFVHSHNNF